MTLTDEQIRALLRDPSKAPPCARHLGFELIDYSVGGGWAEVAFSPRAEFANPALAGLTPPRMRNLRIHV